MNGMGGNAAVNALAAQRAQERREANELLERRRAELRMIRAQGGDDEELALLVSEGAHEVRIGEYRQALRSMSEDSLRHQRELARQERELGLS